MLYEYFYHKYKRNYFLQYRHKVNKCVGIGTGYFLEGSGAYSFALTYEKLYTNFIIHDCTLRATIARGESAKGC